jgi:thiopeptide-type bacteriocin biosynthesis protein
MQLDTYVREVERYGGDDGILLAERLFCVDSEAAVSILESVPGDDGLRWRWKLALCGVDLLLTTLGLTADQKHRWAREHRDGFAREFRADSHLRRQFGEIYRRERQSLEELLSLASDAAEPRYPALQALRRRTEGLVELAAELRMLERAGRLRKSIPELAASYAHMHINRMLRPTHRFQELVLYDLLDRIYLSRLARAGAL